MTVQKLLSEKQPTSVDLFSVSNSRILIFFAILVCNSKSLKAFCTIPSCKNIYFLNSEIAGLGLAFHFLQGIIRICPCLVCQLPL